MCATAPLQTRFSSRALFLQEQQHVKNTNSTTQAHVSTNGRVLSTWAKSCLTPHRTSLTTPSLTLTPRLEGNCVLALQIRMARFHCRLPAVRQAVNQALFRMTAKRQRCITAPGVFHSTH